MKIIKNLLYLWVVTAFIYIYIALLLYISNIAGLDIYKSKEDLLLIAFIITAPYSCVKLFKIYG